MKIELQKEDFNLLISKDICLVDFYANWCGPCKMLSPIIEEIAQEVPNLNIIKVNVDEHEKLAQEYQVMSIPTLILFKDGKIAQKQIGFISKDQLMEWFK